MNHITTILPEIFAKQDRPNKSCPGYDHWLAEQVWKKAQEHFAQTKKESINKPWIGSGFGINAGVACCEQR